MVSQGSVGHAVFYIQGLVENFRDILEDALWEMLRADLITQKATPHHNAVALVISQSEEHHSIETCWRVVGITNRVVDLLDLLATLSKVDTNSIVLLLICFVAGWYCYSVECILEKQGTLVTELLTGKSHCQQSIDLKAITSIKLRWCR